MRSLRVPLVLRRHLDRAQHKAAFMEARYDEVWKDHRSRCTCHNSWDQCPCAETGHDDGDYSCGCCRWCG